MSTPTTPPQPGPKLWERQPNEGPRPYAAWKAYLALGDNRSIRMLSRKLHKNCTTLGQWSSRFGWQERLVAWQSHQDKVEQDALDEEARKRARVWADREQQMRQNRWDDAQAMRAKAKEMMNFPVARRRTLKGGKVMLEPADWNFGQAARLMEAADKIGALACGAATEHTAISGKDGGGVVIGGGEGAAQIVFYIPEQDKPPA